MAITIKKGEKRHLKEVLALIKELALYEKAPLEVSNTLKDMEVDGFGQHPVFSFFVAIEGENIIGMALYYIKYSTWKGKCVFLEDIIVTENYRGKGIGDMLFKEVVKESRKMGVQRMEWQVLDWNEPAINFYRKYDSNFDSEWINCKLTYDQIQNFKFQE